MSDKSSIEWTDATWNPIRGTKGRHHCVRISEGCKHCYAATMNHRFKGPDYVKGADTPRLDEALLQPLKWKAARRIFVCSMTDLFMDEHTDEMIDWVFSVMALADWHTYQVLTKRPKRMREYVEKLNLRKRSAVVQRLLPSVPRGSKALEMVSLEELRPIEPGPLHNVWLGISAENQERADERIPDLLATPAAVRFVSAEPLLGPIKLGQKLCGERQARGFVAGPRINWVIVGGESGPGARPCDVAWIRSIKDQCAAAAVACFVKQLGRWPAVSGEEANPKHPTFKALEFGLKDKKGGDPSEWPEDLRVRQMPGELVPAKEGNQ